MRCTRNELDSSEEPQTGRTVKGQRTNGDRKEVKEGETEREGGRWENKKARGQERELGW